MEILQNKTGYAPDEAIIQKVLDGETTLFEVLIRRYNALLYKIARSYGFNHQDAEDLMQDTHVAAYLQLKNFRKEAAYKSWLTKIHLHKCYHKIHYGHARFETVNEEVITDNARPAGYPSNGTEKKIISKELGKVLEESLQQLPLAYRSVFLLRETEGFSVAETADLLGITEVNVKVRLSRAKTMLQKQIETVYSAADIYDFHLMYCDKIVRNVFERIAANGAE